MVLHGYINALLTPGICLKLQELTLRDGTVNKAMHQRAFVRSPDFGQQQDTFQTATGSTSWICFLETLETRNNNP